MKEQKSKVQSPKSKERPESKVQSPESNVRAPENRAILETKRRGLKGDWTVGTAAALFLLGLWVLGYLSISNAATVTAYPHDIHQATLTEPFIFTPTNVVTFNNTNLFAGPPKAVYPTNGFLTTVLEAGSYTVLIRPRAAFLISVPDSTNTYNIASLVISGALIYDDGTNAAGGFLLYDQ